jgi:large repetitive protein
VSPYSGGSASDGYSTITLNFTDFNEGETFTFTSDVDPLSITGYNSAGNAGAISGLELAGTTVTVNFADGTQESQTFGDGSQGGSDALVPTGIPATVSLEVQGCGRWVEPGSRMVLGGRLSRTRPRPLSSRALRGRT